MKKAYYVFAATLLSSVPALAQAGASDKSYYALATAIVVGLAALGGTMAQGKVGAAAMEGIARNPQSRKDMFVPFILGLALIESLFVLSLVYAFVLNGKI